MRQILCKTCSQEWLPTTPEDIARGLIERRTRGFAKNHYVCDTCDTPIRPGDEAVAITVPGDKIGRWEDAYLSSEKPA